MNKNFYTKIFIFVFLYVLGACIIFLNYRTSEIGEKIRIEENTSNLEGIKLNKIGFNGKEYFIVEKDKAYFSPLDDNDMLFLGLIFALNLGLFALIIHLIKKIEKEKKLFIHTDVESRASNNSLTILAENIHHELNTPLKIIERKYNVLKKMFTYCASSKNLNYPTDDIEDLKNQLTKDELIINDKKFKKETIFEIFELFENSLEQIRAVLNNMRDFKSLRYSNGNKTIYDLADGTMRIIKIVTDFSYDFYIDEGLKHYKIEHSTGLKNADLLNVFINHLKNSLDANSTFIEIKIEKYSSGRLHIIFKDNGNGIPKSLINDIFKPNISSKSPDVVGLRGNGLYLNKQILKTAGGDIKLKKTSSEGTEFEIIVPAKPSKINH